MDTQDEHEGRHKRDQFPHTHRLLQEDKQEDRQRDMANRPTDTVTNEQEIGDDQE